MAQAADEYETGNHSLVLSILFGTRAQELLQCKWIEFVPENERVKQSHICLEDDTYGPFVFLSHDMTKARRARRLPIPPMALVILKRRQVAAAEESLRRGFNRSSRQWVFPAKSKYSKSGHYTNSQTLLDVLAEEAGIERLTRHDARRTLGQFLTACNVHPATSSIILGHAVKAQGEPEGAVVSAIYTKPEFSLIRTEMERVEQAYLATAPTYTTALSPSNGRPLPRRPRISLYSETEDWEAEKGSRRERVGDFRWLTRKFRWRMLARGRRFLPRRRNSAP